MPVERLRLLLADDEPLARELLRGYAARREDLEVVAECVSGDDLAEALARCHPEVALLDIRMPGRSVFDVLAGASAQDLELPSIVFATAFDSYAVRAFELNAVDYLVKPVSAERFDAAIERVRERRRTGEHGEGLRPLLSDLGPRPERVLVPDGDRFVPVAVADIAWIKAEGDYVRVFARGKGYLVNRTLAEIEGRLDPTDFIRIHRSAIVRGEHIREVRPEGAKRFRIGLDDGTTLIVSRSRAPLLKRFML